MSELFGEKSAWVWLDDSDAPNRYMEAETEFVPEGDAPVCLHISVEGTYAAFVNGARVDSTQYSDFPFAKSVQRPDVTPLVRAGRNTLRVQCWFPGQDTSVTRAEKPGLRFEVRQGEKLLAASGTQTRARPITSYQDGPVQNITPQLGYGFERRFAETAPWQAAVIVDKPAVCCPRPIPELLTDACAPGTIIAQGTFTRVPGEHVGDEMQRAGLFWRPLNEMNSAPKKHLPAKDGIRLTADGQDGVFVMIDMGRLYEGNLVLDLVCPGNTRVDVGFGEHLEDMRLRTSVGGRCFGLTCTAPARRERFVHWFRRLGTRYLQLHVFAHEVTIYEAGILPVRYPVDETPRVVPAEPMHARIAEVSRETLLACMHDHYEDCPWREQALYAFDSRNQMLAGYYAFGEFTLPRESLRLLAHSQRDDGLLELCAPARIPITIPSFSLAFIVALEEYCRYSGDLRFAEEMLPTCEKILNTLRRWCRDGLAFRNNDPKYWNFYEWNPLLDGYDKRDIPSAESGLQLFLILALQRMAAIREMLGQPSREVDTALLRELTDGLEQFWDEDERAYASFIQEGRRIQCAELIQSLALYTKACPESRRETLEGWLVHGGLMPVTLSYSLFKYEALLQSPDLTKHVFDEIAERWGDMLCKGATTFWEVDEGAKAFNRAGSLCHGWSAIPLYLYGAYALNVRPTAPGQWTQLPQNPDAPRVTATLNPPT